MPDPVRAWDVAIGARLAEARLATGLSQGAVGAALGCSQAAVCKWETGQNAVSTETLVRLAAVLDTDVHWLLGITASIELSRRHARRIRQAVAALGTVAGLLNELLEQRGE